MTLPSSQVLAFYAMGGLLAVVGLIIGCCGGFDADAWWPVIVGLVLGGVGALVQFGIIDPPLSRKA